MQIPQDYYLPSLFTPPRDKRKNEFSADSPPGISCIYPTIVSPGVFTPARFPDNLMNQSPSHLLHHPISMAAWNSIRFTGFDYSYTAFDYNIWMQPHMYPSDEMNEESQQADSNSIPLIDPVNEPDEDDNTRLNPLGPGPPIYTSDKIRGPKDCNVFVFHLPNEITNWLKNYHNIYKPYSIQGSLSSIP